MSEQKCSFCGTPEKDVKALFASNNGEITICDICVVACTIKLIYGDIFPTLNFSQDELQESDKDEILATGC